MEEVSKLAIPEDVVNPTQYRIYCALKNHPILRNTIYIASDGTEINIAMLPNYLKKRIEHLAPAEQEEILEQKRKYNQMRAKLTTAQSMAYGTAGRLGGKSKEEAVAKFSLSPFEQDVIELLGRMFTVQEVVKIMVQDNQVECEEREVKEILKQHLAEIEKKREQFRDRVADVRLYNKRPRLEELSWMYSKMKTRYIALNSVDAYNAMLRTLEQIRKEAEGDVLNINGAMDVNIEVTIQAHLQREALRTINLKEIILGRVAARMNYDVKKLIAGLHNSQYAKFVQIGDDYDPNAVMEYPSQSIYDFVKIEQQAEQHAVDVKPEELTVEQKEFASNAKDIFLKKIREQRKEMERRQVRWQTATDAEVVEEEQPVKRGAGSGKHKNLISKEKRNKERQEFKGKKYKPEKK